MTFRQIDSVYHKDAFGIWVLADIHRDAAGLLLERYKMSTHSPETAVNMLIPIMTNLAFSIELFYKCLFFIENDKHIKRSHDLLQIFKNFSQTKQQYLIDDFKKRFDSTATYRTIPSGKPKDLLSVLEEIKLSFPILRYLFEGATINFYGYGAEIAIESVRDYISTIKSEWPVLHSPTAISCPHSTFIKR